MIRAIAVDMDGTFLNSENSYDKKKFEEIYIKLKQRGIKFIVASGNQYYQLKSFFPDKDDYIIYISENGALTFQQDKLIDFDFSTNEDVKKTLKILEEFNDNLNYILCGVDSAYILKDSSKEFKKVANKYYFRLQEVANFNNIPNDRFVKIAIEANKEKINQIVSSLRKELSTEFDTVTSGSTSIDLVLKDRNKGNAIKNLIERYSIEKDELLVFGDADNDLEMLALTTHSYAMSNGNDNVKAIANNIAPSNDESGVLTIIENYLEL